MLGSCSRLITIGLEASLLTYLECSNKLSDWLIEEGSSKGVCLDFLFLKYT